LFFLSSLWLLPVVLMLARLNATLSIYLFPYISSGVSLLVKEELSRKMLLFAFCYVVVISLWFDAWWLLLFSPLFGLLVAKAFTKRYGGLNGDMYGFIIETSELFLLNLLIVA